MKTTAFTRLLAAFILIVTLETVQATPPPKVFQLPTSRYNHTFKVWQRTENPPAINEIVNTQQGDIYFVIGSDGAYYFELKVWFNPEAGEFWLEDIFPATPENSPPNTFNLSHALWQAAGSTPLHYLALPVYRAGENPPVDDLMDNIFSLEQAGGAVYGVTKGVLQKVAIKNDTTNDWEWHSLGYFEGWAQFDPTGYQFFRVVDHTAGRRTEWFPFTKTNLAAAEWTAIPAGEPTLVHSVTFHLDTSQIGREFVLYTSRGPARTLRAVRTTHLDANGNLVNDASATVRGSVGEDMDYWLERVVDKKTSPRGHMADADKVEEWVSVFSPLPVAINQTSISFEISTARYNHQFEVRYADGVTLPVPVTRLGPGAVLTNGYDDSGQPSSFAYDIWGASVDDTQDWWLVFTDIPTTSMDEPDKAFGIRATKIYENWHQNVGGRVYGQLAFTLNSTRKNNQLYLYEYDGEFGWPLSTGGTDRPIDIRGPGPGSPVLYSTSVYDASIVGYADESHPWTLRDFTTGEEIGGSGPSNDLSTWHTTATKALNINLTRWNHTLSLKQPGQRSRKIHRGDMQGAAYWTNGSPDFSVNRHFTATTILVPEIGTYTIVDNDTGEELIHPNDAALKGWRIVESSADADGDGLPDWYEISIGTDVHDPDFDGDGYWDGADAFPLDATRHLPPPTPGDVTPPVITILKP